MTIKRTRKAELSTFWLKCLMATFEPMIDPKIEHIIANINKNQTLSSIIKFH